MNPQEPGNTPLNPLDTPTSVPGPTVQPPSNGGLSSQSPPTFTSPAFGDRGPKKSPFVVIAIVLVAIALLGGAAYVIVQRQGKTASPDTSTTALQPNQSSELSDKRNDTERETDIKALQGQIEAYYAQNGKYPTLTNMNDSTFRSDNMKGLDAEALRDPENMDTATIVDKPTPRQYAYIVSPKECNNTSLDCASYTLVATLSSGELFQKQSLN